MLSTSYKILTLNIYFLNYQSESAYRTMYGVHWPVDNKLPILDHTPMTRY